jgi:hypothetical protein
LNFPGVEGNSSSSKEGIFFIFFLESKRKKRGNGVERKEGRDAKKNEIGGTQLSCTCY